MYRLGLAEASGRLPGGMPAQKEAPAATIAAQEQTWVVPEDIDCERAEYGICPSSRPVDPVGSSIAQAAQ
eukprot:CAMPEP_0119318860 /NCGR_PEP_ID=MMETSP1333-20130426/47823_1 /TAXON_ID=418940 /ORGANISM="Scyphosphaera apsteinii, Strain RCC1455" /LENGTH=69 /DNA_ID=CAMNT_0007325155 /DNA_START=224 /DNA_END=434 /DNA_ORIENTATION=-